MLARKALATCALLALAVACSRHTSDELGVPLPPPDPPPSPSLGTSTSFHRIMVAAEIGQLRDPRARDVIGSTFDAFVYGHPLSEEAAVRELRARGLEDWRYFNVFTTDLRYPQWPGFFAGLYGELEKLDGWIPGVRYRWFGGALGPDPIIDHTRPEVSERVASVVGAWADSIGAERVFLDLTFDGLADWMLYEGDQWPWPAGEHAARNASWRVNMQQLVARVARGRRVAINGSYTLDAPVVMFENQPWNHRRGVYSWRALVEHVTRDDVVPILHVGHDVLQTQQEIEGAENMTLAVWLLADRAYLYVEYEDAPLSFAGRAIALGLRRFEPDGAAEEVSPGVWHRTGTINGAPWEVEVDARVGRGEVAPVGP